jgi:hypothetical protein
MSKDKSLSEATRDAGITIGNPQAGGKPNKGTPKDKRLKENKPKVTKD